MMNTTAKKRRSIKDNTTSATIQSTPLLFAHATLRGSIAATLCAAILSLVTALISYMNADPDSLLTPLALAVLAISATIAGFVAWRSARTAPLLCGVLCGLILILLFFFFSCFFPDSLRSSWSPGLLWGLRGGVMLFCVLGAIMAANMPTSKRAKHKKRR